MTVKLHINHEEVLFKKWNFPGGEVGVKIEPVINAARAVQVSIIDIPTSEDFFVACNLLDAVVRMGIPKEVVTLYIPYFPYARQDRKCHEGESFALYVYVNLLMQMH